MALLFWEIVATYLGIASLGTDLFETNQISPTSKLSRRALYAGVGDWIRGLMYGQSATIYSMQPS